MIVKESNNITLLILNIIKNILINTNKKIYLFVSNFIEKNNVNAFNTVLRKDNLLWNILFVIFDILCLWKPLKILFQYSLGKTQVTSIFIEKLRKKKLKLSKDLEKI